jgi:hypothetical protein
MASPTRRRKLVYKFLPAEFALQNLIKREIKISTFADMNDPFELLGGLSIAADVAHHFQAVIDWLSGYCGVLCSARIGGTRCSGVTMATNTAEYV